MMGWEKEPGFFSEFSPMISTLAAQWREEGSVMGFSKAFA